MYVSRNSQSLEVIVGKTAIFVEGDIFSCQGRRGGGIAGAGRSGNRRSYPGRAVYIRGKGAKIVVEENEIARNENLEQNSPDTFLGPLQVRLGLLCGLDTVSKVCSGTFDTALHDGLEFKKFPLFGVKLAGAAES